MFVMLLAPRISSEMHVFYGLMRSFKIEIYGINYYMINSFGGFQLELEIFAIISKALCIIFCSCHV